MKYNLNQQIKVKLSSYGYSILANESKRLCELSGGFIKSHTEEYYQKQADADGYTIYQLWDFMNLFGSSMCIGNKGPLVDNNIEFTNG